MGARARGRGPRGRAAGAGPRGGAGAPGGAPGGAGARRGPALPPRERPVPRDGPGERVLMGLFNAKLEGALPGGQRPGRGFEASWEGFVEAAEAVAAKRPPVEQHRLIAGVLESIMPPFVPPFLRWAFRPSPFVCWVNALIAQRFFAWLVGPSDIFEVEAPVPGGRPGETVRQMSGLKIERCRYLDETRCAGRCVNICKIPTQKFIREQLGVPVYLKPDYEDLSCEMCFGVPPPDLADDPAVRQSCFQALEEMAWGTGGTGGGGGGGRGAGRTEAAAVRLPLAMGARRHPRSSCVPSSRPCWGSPLGCPWFRGGAVRLGQRVRPLERFLRPAAKKNEGLWGRFNLPLPLARMNN